MSTRVGTVGLLVWVLACGGSCRTADLVDVLVDRDPRVLFEVEVAEPVVALTVDDAPDPATTSGILDVLAAHDARATFFVLSDRVPESEPVLRRMTVEGHEIANHGARDTPAVDLGAEAFEAQLVAAHAALEPFGVAPWYRPGSGWYDDWMIEIVERRGYRLALGSNYPLDATFAASARWTTRAILWGVNPGDVIILHDGGDRGRRTAAVLQRLLPRLRERGYRVVTLSELVGIAEPGG